MQALLFAERSCLARPHAVAGIDLPPQASHRVANHGLGQAGEAVLAQGPAVAGGPGILGTPSSGTASTSPQWASCCCTAGPILRLQGYGKEGNALFTALLLTSPEPSRKAPKGRKRGA
jgi:hypothetical protein